jgi:hypothetical protein
MHPFGSVGETQPQVGDLLLQCEQFGIRVGGAIVTIESHRGECTRTRPKHVCTCLPV